MKTFVALLLVSLLAPPLAAQKPSLALEDLEHGRWPRVQAGQISHDGRYVLYTIHNQPVGQRTLVLQATEGAWKLEIPGATGAQFTEDSRRAVFQRRSDSLAVVTLGTSAIEYRAGVSSFTLFRRGRQEFLAYQQRGAEAGRTLLIEELATGQRQRFADVASYRLSADGRHLILQQSADQGRVRLTWVQLPAGRRTTVWEGGRAGSVVFDARARNVAFVAQESDTTPDTTADGPALWYYAAGTARATRVLAPRSPAIDRELMLDGVSGFSLDGRRVFVTLKARDEVLAPNPEPNSEAVAVDVWHYRDATLQSQQLVEAAGGGGLSLGPPTYTAVVDLRSHQVIRLQDRHEELWLLNNATNDGWGLITRREGDRSEEGWNPLAVPRYSLVSTRTGERQAVQVPFRSLSPAGKYLLGEDGLGNFWSYELATGVVREITESLPVPAGDAGYDEPWRLQHRGVRYATRWLPRDAAVLLYDRYDVWQVDPRGRTAPVNLTNGYGRRHQIVFRVLDDTRVHQRGDRLLLDAFDLRTKDNGFYRLVLGAGADPVRLTMGPYVFAASPYHYLGGERPVKARDAERYLVRRGSATESPNYFWTSDFRRFTPLSDVHPERRYRWVTSELVTFPTLDGRTAQGVLYKPEDFDSTKKYPVILHYYETKSERLNEYPRPDFSDGNINIPYFVGRGYLVFTPDIHYTVGVVGESAVNAIVGAGRYLQTLPWVDGARIGLSGHSFGGYETNYVITHSDLFAAAVADAGAVDFISGFGTYEFQSGVSLQALHELTYYRLGGTPWRDTDVYVRNSPIFQADQVTTPVLLINNKLDAIVHFEQGVAFFTALRRLGKRAWLLQYDGEPHSLRQEKNQRDLTIRITQFFDHYLKGAPAPVWMTRGVPAKYKGIKAGLEYDPEITTPGRGLVLDATATAATGRIQHAD